MRIQKVCQRCRTVFGEIDIQGGSSGFNEFLLGMSGLQNRTLCFQCGGWVYAVQDGKALPLEYRPTIQRLAWAALLSAGSWLIFSWVGAMMIVEKPEKELDQAQKEALATEMFGFPARFALCGGFIGLVLPLGIALMARFRQDLNEPYDQSLMPLGQAMLLLPALGVAVILGVVLAKEVAPLFGPVILGLRNEGARSAIGGIIGLLAGSLSHLVLFKVCRR